MNVKFSKIDSSFMNRVYTPPSQFQMIVSNSEWLSKMFGFMRPFCNSWASCLCLF